MFSAGIDVGGKNVHIVIMHDGKVVAKAAGPTGSRKTEAAEKLYDKLLATVGITRSDVGQVVATGISGKRAPFAKVYIPDVTGDARGINTLFPSVRTVIDVGA